LSYHQNDYFSQKISRKVFYYQLSPAVKRLSEKIFFSNSEFSLVFAADDATASAA
jgi:hypothetical protein